MHPANPMMYDGQANTKTAVLIFGTFIDLGSLVLYGVGVGTLQPLLADLNRNTYI